MRERDNFILGMKAVFPNTIVVEHGSNESESAEGEVREEKVSPQEKTSDGYSWPRIVGAILFVAGTIALIGALVITNSLIPISRFVWGFVETNLTWPLPYIFVILLFVFGPLFWLVIVFRILDPSISKTPEQPAAAFDCPHCGRGYLSIKKHNIYWDPQNSMGYDYSQDPDMDKYSLYECSHCGKGVIRI